MKSIDENVNILVRESLNKKNKLYFGDYVNILEGDGIEAGTTIDEIGESTLRKIYGVNYKPSTPKEMAEVLYEDLLSLGGIEPEEPISDVNVEIWSTLSFRDEQYGRGNFMLNAPYKDRSYITRELQREELAGILSNLEKLFARHLKK